MKLWNKGFEIDSRIEEFTIGKDKELDLLLAEFDVIGSIAHITMLESIGLLGKYELGLLKEELYYIYIQIQEGDFKIDDDVEDVHSQVEKMLTSKLGDLGKKIHSGRSRNDQILLDLKLFTRSRILNVSRITKNLFDTLINLSEKYKDVKMPGYTHYQVAMPSSFGLWFGSFAESLLDDLVQLQAAYKISNKNPLGSAAGYGSSFPLNRRLTTNLLAFEDLNYNSVYAQMGRGKTERVVAQALGSIGSTLNKLSQDICLFTNQNYGFIKLPDKFTTGSSIMPHKKNPDVFEIIRAKTNKLNSLSNEIILITTNLSSGYHRDLQIIKESFLPVFQELIDCLEICEFVIKQIEVNTDILSDDRYKYIFSVDDVNRLVVDGMSFRDAYKKIADEIQNGTYESNNSDVTHTHEGSIGNLCNESIVNEMDKVMQTFNFFTINSAFERLLQPEIQKEKEGIIKEERPPIIQGGDLPSLLHDIGQWNEINKFLK